MPESMANPAASPPAPAGDDPFERLHKMSITAGLGSGDYVAISGTAIAAVLLGVASVMVLFHTHLLLLIPAAAVVCAVVAWVQVGRSNGTLTGRGLAVLGLVLGVGLGGYEGGQVVSADLAGQSAQRQIVNMIHDFGQDIVHENYDAAYQMCDDGFRAATTLPAFEGRWRQIRNSAVLGHLTAIEWNGLLSFDTDPVSGRPVASGMVKISFDRSREVSRTDMFFRKDDRGWGIDRIPQLFAPPDPKSSKGKGGVYGPPKPV